MSGVGRKGAREVRQRVQQEELVGGVRKGGKEKGKESGRKSWREV